MRCRFMRSDFAKQTIKVEMRTKGASPSFPSSTPFPPSSGGLLIKQITEKSWADVPLCVHLGSLLLHPTVHTMRMKNLSSSTKTLRFLRAPSLLEVGLSWKLGLSGEFGFDLVETNLSLLNYSLLSVSLLDGEKRWGETWEMGRKKGRK